MGTFVVSALMSAAGAVAGAGSDATSWGKCPSLAPSDVCCHTCAETNHRVDCKTCMSCSAHYVCDTVVKCAVQTSGMAHPWIGVQRCIEHRRQLCMHIDIERVRPAMLSSHVCSADCRNCSCWSSATLTLC